MKSKASGMTDYVAIQVRTRGGGVHIQGKGVSINRPYGVAVQAADNTDGQILVYLNSIVGDLESLAGTDAQYVSAQAAIRGDKVHIQVESDVEFNRAYGASFDAIEVPELAQFVTAQLEAEPKGARIELPEND